MEIKCIADGGAYASDESICHLAFGSAGQQGPYYCENVKTDVYAAYTNNNYPERCADSDRRKLILPLNQ